MHALLKIPIYPYRVLVSVAETDESLRKYMRRIGEDVHDDDFELLKLQGAGRWAGFPKRQMVMIRLKGNPNDAVSRGTLAHEVDEIATWMIDQMGWQTSRETSEPRAYLVGYITQQIYAKF